MKNFLTNTFLYGIGFLLAFTMLDFNSANSLSTFDNKSATDDAEEIFQIILYVMWGLAGFAATVAIILIGYKLIQHRGSEENYSISRAMKELGAVGIGTLLIFSAALISQIMYTIVT